MLDECCIFCGSDTPFELYGVSPRHREIDGIYCCEGSRDAAADFFADLTDVEWRDYWKAYFDQSHVRGGILAATGLEVRSVVRDADVPFTLDFKLRLVKLDREGDQKRARRFIARHHRHLTAPPGWRYGFAVYNGRDLIGVAWCGRPVARRINHFTTVEVNRNCVRTDLHPQLVAHACSMLYGAASREAERRGYVRVISYILKSEAGTTLKAAGFVEEHTTREGDSWESDAPQRKRKQKAPTEAKVRWARELNPPNEARRALQEAERDAAVMKCITPLWKAVMAEIKGGRKPAPPPPPPPPRPAQAQLF